MIAKQTQTMHETEPKPYPTPHKWVWKKPLYLIIFPAILTVGRFAVALDIENPIKTKSFNDLILVIVNGIMLIAFPFAALAIVIAGFKFITGAVSGNPGEVQKAKTLFFWIIIGTAIVVGANVIARVVINFVKENL